MKYEAFKNRCDQVEAWTLALNAMIHDPECPVTYGDLYPAIRKLQDATPCLDDVGEEDDDAGDASEIYLDEILAEYAEKMAAELAGDRESHCPVCDGFREFTRGDEDKIRCPECGTTAEWMILHHDARP